MNPKKLKILSYFLVLTLIVSIGLSGSMVGCKQEAAPVEEEVTEEEAAPVEEEVTEEEAEEEIELGTESATYWIEKAGLEPKGEFTIYSYKDEGVTEWKIAEKYVEAYPEVSYNWVSIPGGEFATKIAMECETGTQGFDVMWSYTAWTTTFHEYLYDVTDIIPEELRNDVVEGIRGETVVYDGKWHGYPLFLGTGGTVYNKEILEKAGYDEVPELWDEYFEAASASTIDEDGDGTPEVFGHTGYCGPFGYIASFGWVLKSVGGEFWNEDRENPEPLFNDEKGIRALEILKTLYMSDFSDPVMAAGDEVATRRSIAAEKAAMGFESIGSVWGVANADFPEMLDKLAWATLPHDPGYESYAINASMGFVIGEHTENLDAALGYILFYASPEIQKFMTEDYGFPSARVSLASDEEYVSKYPFVPTAIEAGKRAYRYTEENQPELQDKWFPIFQNYFTDKIDAQAALDQMESIFIEAWEG